jgi:phage shock protein C
MTNAATNADAAYAPAPRAFNLGRENAKIAGVCSGIANYTGIDTTLVRLAFTLGTVLGFGWLVIAYIVIALVAD